MTPPHDIVAAVERDHPQAWAQLDDLRSQRAELGGWPDWCWCPMAGAMAVVSRGGTPTREHAADVARVAAAAAWRARPLVWRADVPPSTVALPGDRLEGELLLAGLPRWCTWVEVGNLPPFFVHLEHDANTGRPELRLAIVAGGHVLGVPVHLDQPTVGYAVASALYEVTRQARAMRPEVLAEVEEGWEAILGLLLPLALTLARRPALAEELTDATE